MPRFSFLLTCSFALCFAASSLAQSEASPERRWVYLQLNLQVRDNVPRAEEIMRRAAKAGYNGIVLADYKLNILDRVPEHYFTHFRQFKKTADELNLEIIPTVCSIGYSDGILAHNPNLAEGLPVKEAAFVVRGGVAQLEVSLRNPLPGGGFDEHRSHLVSGWNFQDAPGKTSFVDAEVKHAGKSSLRWENPGESKESGGNARVSRQVEVSPWRQYHASVWIKTQDYDSASSVRLFAMDEKGKPLSHSNLGVQRTQDWTEHHVIFNSLGNQKVRIYCGTWGGRRGTLWMDELQLEETAFVNVLRREGCPLVVSDGQGTVYKEGKDYAELRDPKAGEVPWTGGFEVYHEPPQLRVLPGSKIQDGQPLKVSFSHAVTIYDNQVTCCLGNEKVFEILESQVRRVNELMKPTTYFLSHDEIRVANWCGSCNRPGRTAGELLAENVSRCVELIRNVSPDARLCVWSDMFDPHHNARDNFYLVHGDLAGSWNGLPREMTIVNWNSGKPGESLPFFAGRGHRQVLAGYYDHNPQGIVSWLAAGKGLAGVDGVMYTTWQSNFKDLEAFAQAAWGGK